MRQFFLRVSALVLALGVLAVIVVHAGVTAGCNATPPATNAAGPPWPDPSASIAPDPPQRFMGGTKAAAVFHDDDMQPPPQKSSKKGVR